MRHQQVALIGGSGFIGSHLVNALVDLGKNVRIATRRRSNAAHLTLLPVDVIETDVHDPAQLAAFVGEADAVVNLVGILQGSRGEPYGPEFAKAHVEFAAQERAHRHAAALECRTSHAVARRCDRNRCARSGATRGLRRRSGCGRESRRHPAGLARRAVRTGIREGARGICRARSRRRARRRA